MRVWMKRIFSVFQVKTKTIFQRNSLGLSVVLFAKLNSKYGKFHLFCIFSTMLAELYTIDQQLSQTKATLTWNHLRYAFETIAKEICTSICLLLTIKSKNHLEHAFSSHHFVNGQAVENNANLEYDRSTRTTNEMIIQQGLK